MPRLIAASPRLSNLRRVPAPLLAKFYRSAAPTGFDAEAVAQLERLELRTVVDLREPFESLAPVDGVLTGTISVSAPLYNGALPVSTPIEQVYSDLLTTRGTEIAKAVGIVAAALPHGVLIHCAAGKDRTGLVVALILEAVGTDRTTVLADYTLSAKSMTESYQEMKRDELSLALGSAEDIATALQLHLESPAEALETSLDWVASHFGSAAGYLLANGSSLAELTLLCAHLARSHDAAVPDTPC
ncbi:tyrosine-protein phosphatase [Arthrobacter antibioticus]|uniref:tyrosine-protein phosphatase n=1 Tax=Arthrobacter sp. H35-MC1 TaxID=3046203 RepID=UPI0024BA3389|nr:tyrosine-protein phosphatase [Arthrobacter sp. H35-MC1]MDJ0318301.1 tyrosine-protein phosphatase [Arthrobacter sp. H35-MC1]